MYDATGTLAEELMIHFAMTQIIRCWIHPQNQTKTGEEDPAFGSDNTHVSSQNVFVCDATHEWDCRNEELILNGYFHMTSTNLAKSITVSLINWP